MGEFKPGEEITGMSYRLDEAQKQAIERAVQNLDPQYLRVLMSNDEFINMLAMKLSKRMAPRQHTELKARPAEGQILGEQFEQRLLEEEGVNLDDGQDLPEGPDADAQTWAPPQAPPYQRAPSKAPPGFWQFLRPGVPKDQQAGLGEAPAGQWGGVLMILGAIAAIGLIGHRFLKNSDDELVEALPFLSEREHDAVENPVERPVKAVFPWDRSLSAARNDESLYKGGA